MCSKTLYINLKEIKNVIQVVHSTTTFTIGRLWKCILTLMLNFLSSYNIRLRLTSFVDKTKFPHTTDSHCKNKLTEITFGGLPGDCLHYKIIECEVQCESNPNNICMRLKKLYK